MQSTDQIKLPDTSATKLPLGYRKILLAPIPPAETEARLMLYNARYAFFTKMVNTSGKPISKIIQ